MAYVRYKNKQIKIKRELLISQILMSHSLARASGSYFLKASQDMAHAWNPIYRPIAYFCRSIGLRSVAPCLGISRPLVVGASFSLLMRDAVIKCVHSFERNPSTV